MELNECNHLHIVTHMYDHCITFKIFNINLLLIVGCFVPSILVTLIRLLIIYKNLITRVLEIIDKTFEIKFLILCIVIDIKTLNEIFKKLKICLKALENLVGENF